MSQISLKLRNLMKERGWSMRHTAKIADLPIATLRSIIYGQSKNQKQTTLTKIAKAFQCSIDSLSMISDNDNSRSNSLNEQDICITIDNYNILTAYLADMNLSISKDKQVKIISKLNSLGAINNRQNQKFSPDSTLIKWLIEDS